MLYLRGYDDINCNGNVVTNETVVYGCDEDDIYVKFNCPVAYATTTHTALSTKSPAQKSNQKNSSHSIIITIIGIVIGFICVSCSGFICWYRYKRKKNTINDNVYEAFGDKG